MFPAREGDCLIIEYGEDHRKPERILIDGGRRETYRKHLGPYLARLTNSERMLRLAVVTHVDRDHIEGCVDLLRDPLSRIATCDISFNDYQNLLSDEPPSADLGGVLGEALSRLISYRRWPRNVAFGWGAVSTGPRGEPRSNILVGPGLKATLLGPDRAALESLEPIWKRECARAGIEAGVIAPEVVEPERATMAGEPVLARRSGPDGNRTGSEARQRIEHHIPIRMSGATHSLRCRCNT
jgi:hypothetical protein